ncbi:MAG: spondin domain-containing protein [Gammaproteobacteria bacterium]|nr:spondin domain-containing protein [Gammaproteobacteria bacterium]
MAALLIVSTGAAADSLTPSPPDPEVATRSLARYEVVFEGAWTLQSTPGGVPSSAHFTSLIGGIHDDQVVFLENGERASLGVEYMAELGLTQHLANEVLAAGAVVLHRAGDIRPEGMGVFDAVELSTDSPRVTLTTMVAPSPDWFVGVSGLSLLDPDGQWVMSRTVNLYPWDAGTEDGSEFSLNNPETSPQGVITSLRGQGKFTTERIASLSFTLQSVLPAEGGPEIIEEFGARTLVAGAQAPVDMGAHFRDEFGGTLDYTAHSSDSEVVSVSVRNDQLWLTAIAPGSAMVTVRAVDAEGDGATQVFAVQVTGAHRVWVFPAADDADGRQGFVRTINASPADAVVSVLAIDELGREYGPATFTVPAGAAVQFNSTDLEDGEGAFADGLGRGMGTWRLELESDADIEVRSYLRTRPDGFVTPMAGAAPRIGNVHRVAFFNPGSNTEQVSVLRIVNAGPDDAAVTIGGVDDAGDAADAAIQTTVAADRTIEISAADLESGAGLTGALGDGEGKWRLTVTSTQPVTVLSLLETSGGHLANLSEVPVRPLAGDSHPVWTFPSASDPLARQGFVRVINHSDVGGDVTIEAIDDVGNTYDPLTLRVDPGAVAAFNSEDVEGGEPEKGLIGSTGPGVGDWRLVLTSELDIEVLPYIRTSDGFVTSMHRVAPSASGRHRVAIFNPASNPNQLSRLRIINPGTEPAAVVIAGIDDNGSRSAASVEADIPPGEVRELRSAAPTRMGVVLVPSGLEDVFGDGQGKWRLDLDSPTPITVVNLLASPTGHLTNLSAAKAP